MTNVLLIRLTISGLVIAIGFLGSFVMHLPSLIKVMLSLSYVVYSFYTFVCYQVLPL